MRETETEELVRLDREMEKLLRRRLELAAGPESGSTGYDRCRRAMGAARSPVSRPRVVYQGVAGAYSEMAALAFFGKEARCQGLDRFEDVFEAVSLEACVDGRALPGGPAPAATRAHLAEAAKLLERALADL